MLLPVTYNLVVSIFFFLIVILLFLDLLLKRLSWFLYTGKCRDVKIDGEIVWTTSLSSKCFSKRKRLCFQCLFFFLGHDFLSKPSSTWHFL